MATARERRQILEDVLYVCAVLRSANCTVIMGVEESMKEKVDEAIARIQEFEPDEKLDDVELVQFVIHGVTSESKPAFMCMSRERYNRIMPPFLMEPVEVIGSGNGDEHCYVAGHSWGNAFPYMGDLANGVQIECTVCGREASRDWSA